MENQINVSDQNTQQVGQNPVSQPVQVPEKPKINYWIVLAIGLGLCLLLATFYILTLNNKIKDIAQNNNQALTPSDNQTSTPTPIANPTSTNVTNFPKRQFSLTEKLFEDREYPVELSSIPESDLVGMSCSKDYFSWSGNDYSYTDPKTNETTKLSDSRLLTYLSKAEANHGKGNIISIAYCDIENGKTIVGYRAGPCGGGCAGIQHFSYADNAGNLTLMTKVQPQEEGAYYGCKPAELTKNKILYLKCSGEGTASVQKLDLTTNTYTPVISCRYTNYGEPDSTITCK